MTLNAACCERTNVSSIKFEEGASKAIFLNPSREWHIKVQIDGCLVTNERAADAALYNSNADVIIVELKGVDVAYGAKQIIAAAEVLRTHEPVPRSCAGLVVGKEYPKISTTIQRMQAQFAKAYKRPLHIVTKNGEFEFAAVHSFRGPFKV